MRLLSIAEEEKYKTAEKVRHTINWWYKRAKLVQFIDKKISVCRAEKHSPKSSDQCVWKKEKDQTILQDKRPDRHSLRSRIRELKNAWFQKKAKETGQYSEARKRRECHATLNAVYDPRSRSSYPVRSNYGVLFIRSRWNQGQMGWTL